MQYRRPLLRKMVFFNAAFGYKGRPKSTVLPGKHNGHHSGYTNEEE
jgi:hypothetical protein